MVVTIRVDGVPFDKVFDAVNKIQKGALVAVAGYDLFEKDDLSTKTLKKCLEKLYDSGDDELIDEIDKVLNYPLGAE